MAPFLPTRRPISNLLLFALKNPNLTPTPFLQVLRFSTSPSFAPPYPSRRQEEESRGVRVSVWWDFENCTFPVSANVFKLAHFINAAVRTNGIKGPITITAFGDVVQLSRANQEALSSTGINLIHIPNGGKNSADRSLLVDLMYWVSQNPPPAHLFLISGDRDFASVLHRLRMNNYNILLASPNNAPGVLCSAASIMWQWQSLVKGENLTGKHFNQPPDGPNASWYGHYRAPLEDPFALIEQPSIVRTEETSECSPDPKPGPIPRAVMDQIRNILNSYPKGLSITDLRAELLKNNVYMDKKFFGYKSFSRFLLAMPQILKLQSVRDGQHLIHGVTRNIPEADYSNPSSAAGPVTQNEGLSSVITPNQNGEKSSPKELADEKSSVHLMTGEKFRSASIKQQEPKRVHELPKPYTEVMGDKLKSPPSPEPALQSDLSLQESSKEARETAQCAKYDTSGVTKKESQASEKHSSASKPGIFRRIWKKWLGSEDSVLKEKESSLAGKTPGPLMKTEKKDVKLTVPGADSIIPPSVSAASNKAAGENQPAENFEATIDNSRRAPSFLQLIMSWFTPRISSEESDGSCEKPAKLDSLHQQLFSQESFWNDMKEFLDTPKGSSLVLQSKTRLQMGRYFKKDGPAVLQSFSDDDLLLLVDSLISDKKWVEECANLSSPFKLAGTDLVQNASKCNVDRSSGLSSIFLDTQQQPGPKRQELSGEKKFQSPPHTGVSRPGNPGKLTGKSRSEILADCQDLVEFIVKEYPEGFNMGAFRKLFLERYGYSLEIQKLGYQRLIALLQIMPGIRIESTYIIPSGKASKTANQDVAEPMVGEDKDGLEANSNNESKDDTRKDDETECPWEELGPLAVADMREENNNKFNKKAKDESKGPAHHNYELLSDDDFSDSDGEATPSTKSEGGENRKENEGDSSLLQILDSWYSSKEGSKRKNDTATVNGEDEPVKDDDAAPSAAPAKDMLSYGRSKKLPKRYSFVAEPQRNDKLVDGILGSLKKSGERSTETQV